MLHCNCNNVKIVEISDYVLPIINYINLYIAYWLFIYMY